MAITLGGSLAFTVTQTGSHDFGTPTLPMFVNQVLSLSSGTGSNAADEAWGDQRTLSTTSETLDLSGSLTNAFGTTVAFVEVRTIYIRHTGSTGVLTIGNAASNQAYAGLLNGATAAVVLGPGGIFQLGGSAHKDKKPAIVHPSKKKDTHKKTHAPVRKHREPVPATRVTIK